MTLNQINQYTLDLKEEISQLPWHEDDVRSSFFHFYFTVIREFYIQKVLFDHMNHIAQGKTSFSQDLISFKPHFESLVEITSNKPLIASFHHAMNRNITLDSWTTFESTLNLIFRQLITEEGRKVIVKKLNKDLLKTLSKTAETDSDAILRILNKSSFIPLLRKFDYLVSRRKKCYQGDKKDDRKFLEFANAIRNCSIHSNGLYFGINFSYQFEGSEFIFKNGEAFTEDSKNPLIHFKMAVKLKGIFTNILKCIEDIELFQYPDDGQNVA